MSAIVRFVGGSREAVAALAERLRAASSVEVGGAEAAVGQAYPAATPMVDLVQTAELAIAAASHFARTHAAEAEDRVVVNIWHVPAWDDWEASRDAATLAAFTRYAARAWAGQRVRVNGVTLPAAPGGSGVAEDEIAGTILALWRWRSMTGQVINLGG